jgi:hypothetical protein
MTEWHRWLADEIVGRAIPRWLPTVEQLNLNRLVTGHRQKIPSVGYPVSRCRHGHGYGALLPSAKAHWYTAVRAGPPDKEGSRCELPTVVCSTSSNSRHSRLPRSASGVDRFPAAAAFMLKAITSARLHADSSPVEYKMVADGRAFTRDVATVLACPAPNDLRWDRASSL